MSAATTIAPTRIELLRKIWARTSSSFAPEAANAREKAATLLARYGKTVADIPDLLAANAKTSGPAQEWAGFTFYDINNPDHMAAQAESNRKWRSERAGTEAPEREAVISRYGSVDAAIAPCEREVLLRESVLQWSTPCDPPHQRWTKRIGEWEGPYSDIPSHVREALSAAYPLPTTIEEAGAEYNYWQRRDHEMGLVLEDTSHTQLDLAADGRRKIVRDLLETGLRAQTIADVLVRQRHRMAHEYSMPEVEQAVLADLEHLTKIAETAPRQPVQTGQARTTASDRRAEVIRLLSNVDSAHLSDREIARLVGVSPQTVGNIRRKHETLNRA
jgi:DNA-binding CsgD family transcriptional regulator